MGLTLYNDEYTSVLFVAVIVTNTTDFAAHYFNNRLIKPGVFKYNQQYFGTRRHRSVDLDKLQSQCVSQRDDVWPLTDPRLICVPPNENTSRFGINHNFFI